jgi:3-hydroxybutyryl-CoA dehydrogenase
VGDLDVIGVVGAGTMGAGIAQLAAQAGARCLLADPDAQALERGLEAARGRIERGIEKGRLRREDLGALEGAADLAALKHAGLVIEAAPEDLELKRELFRALAEYVAEDCVLASNTSSLSVTALAAGVPGPERVVGMHFFNPPPLMQLLEVVAGERSGEPALARARAAGEAMGKTVITAADGPGFLVNRCNRPFALEGLRLVEQRIATPEQVDRICRMAGGFKMGPFELMDLVGVDVGFTISKSFFEQSFHEPRWRPSPLAARAVAAGRHGRKTGEGWYRYPDGPPPDPEPPEAGGGDGLIVIAGESELAEELAEAAIGAGWDVAAPEDADGDVPELIVDCGGHDGLLQCAPQLLLCDAAPLAAQDPGGPSAGFHLLPPFGRLAELTSTPATAPATLAAAERFFGTLGMATERVGDAPGLVLGRIVAQLVNEACFAVGEGVGSPADVDAGMVLGLNHPRGPMEWGDEIGAAEVLVLLTALQEEYREERYRPAPELLRAARAGEPLRPDH